MPAPRSHPDEITVGIAASVRRARDAKLLGLFLLAALPVAAVLWFLLNPLFSVLYVVAQTLFLWFGLRRRHSPVLRLSPDGLSYEPGTFQVVCGWADVDALGPVDLPDGRAEALLLSEGHLHWAVDARTRRQAEARGWDRAVPIGAFEPEWEWGLIGKAIRAWAPWIFDLPEREDDTHA